MLRQSCAVALVAAITFSLPAGPVAAQDAIDQAQALTQATYRRMVEVRFEGAPTEVIANLLTAALGPIETKMGQYGTLIARSVSEGPDGKWTMVNYWTDRDAMNRVNQEALTWPEFGALPGVANLETLQMQQLDVDTTVGLCTFAPANTCRFTNPPALDDW